MAGMYGIADNCPDLDEAVLKKLAAAHRTVGGKKILNLLADARAGKRLEF
jgi:hypothetical protein